MKKLFANTIKPFALLLAAGMLALGLFSCALAQEGGIGTTIESIDIKWITSDSTTMFNGTAVPQDVLEDDSYLFIAAPNNNDLTMAYQFEVAFSGEKDYMPGQIEIRVPQRIWHERMLVDDGNGGKMGVPDPDRMIGDAMFSIPEEPNYSADFTWAVSGTDYLITNARPIGATSSAMFQIAFTDIVPGLVPDMSISEPVQVHCSVKTEEGTVSLSSDKIYAQLDTGVKINHVYKKAGKQNFDRPEGVTDEMLQKLPEGAKAKDYVYVAWSASVDHTSSQAATFIVKDSLGSVYEVVVGEDDKKSYTKIGDGILLGCSGLDNVAGSGSEWELEAVESEHRICNFSSNLDHMVTIWVAYHKTLLGDALGGLTQMCTNSIENTVEWTLVETDAPVEAGRLPADSRESVSKQTVGKGLYEPLVWVPPVGKTDLVKESRNGLAGGLNLLMKGDSLEMTFLLQANMFSYELSARGNVGSDQEASEINEEDLGYRGIKTTVEDRKVILSELGDKPLTAEDYEITGMWIPNPKTYIYKAGDGKTHGYYMTKTENSRLEWGPVSETHYGWFQNDGQPKPDLHVEYQLNGDGEWRKAATIVYGEAGMGKAAFTYVSDEVTASLPPVTAKDPQCRVVFPQNTTNVRYSFQQNVFNGQTAERCNTAAILWPIEIEMTLKPSEKVVDMARALYETQDSPETNLYNHAWMEVEGYIGEVKEDGTPAVVQQPQDDFANVLITGTAYGASLHKYVHYNPQPMENGGDNDTANRRVILHYGAEVNYDYNYNVFAMELFGEDGSNFIEDTGIWYDLLPEGAEPLLSTLKLGSGDTITRVETIPNFRGTGRTLLIVEADVKPQMFPMNDRTRGTLYYYLDVSYPWDHIDLYGDTVTNYIVFQSTSDNLSISNHVLGTQKHRQGEPDDPTPEGGNFNSYTPEMPEQIAEALTDLDPSTDENRFLYAKATQQGLTVLRSSLAGISKTASTPISGRWSTGLEGVGEVTAYEGGPYSYRLMVSSAESSVTSGIRLYDSLENYRIPADDISKANEYSLWQSRLGWKGDWHDMGQWRGTLQNVDVTDFVNAGAAPRVYYTTDPSVTLLENAHFDLSGSAWQQAQLTTVDGKTLWNVPQQLAGSVWAIAVDASQKADGSVFKLGAETEVCAYINMLAPADGGMQETWKAKGAFAQKTAADGTTVEVDWMAAMDPTNNMYAYNNVYMNCVVSNVEDPDAGQAHLIRNDYTRVGLVPCNLQVVKEWKDDDDHDAIRPDEVTITLLKKSAQGVFEPVLDQNGAPRTLVLNEENDWSGLFTQVDWYNADGSLCSYSFSEEGADGYTLSVIPGSTGVYLLTNIHQNETVTLSGQKLWEDEDDRHGARPEEIELNVLRDGEYYTTTTVRPDTFGNWNWSIEGLEKYERGGREYVYTVEEERLPNYAAAWQNENTLVNTYVPVGDLTIEKTVENVTSKIADRDYHFTLLLTQTLGQDVVPIEGSFAYKLYEKTGEEWEQIGDGQFASGARFTLRHGQKVTVFDLPAGIEYAVDETLDSLCPLTSSTNTQGVVYGGVENKTEFVNTYKATGAVTLTAEKIMTGQALRPAQFRFKLVDKETGNVVQQAYSGIAHSERNADGEIVSTAPIRFSDLIISAADHGKTRVFELVEVRDDPISGTTYDETVYELHVKVEDNGDGTVTLTGTRVDNGAALDGADGKITFENSYKATGEVVLKAWKTMKGREVEVGEFTFALYRFDGTDRTGDAIATVTNDAEGNIVFPALAFDQTNVGIKESEPMVYSYVMCEVPGDDATVSYTDEEYVVHITPIDNRNGTLSFEQQIVGARREEAACLACSGTGMAEEDCPNHTETGCTSCDGTGGVLTACTACGATGSTAGALNVSGTQAVPEFHNIPAPGMLSITKKVTGDGDPAQEFTFHVTMTGEEVSNLDYTLGTPSQGGSTGGGAGSGSDGTGSGSTPSGPAQPDTSKYFHATPEQLKGKAYSVLENGVLTIFRSEDMTDHLGRKFEVADFLQGDWSEPYYSEIDEENLETVTVLEHTGFDEYHGRSPNYKVERIVMKGALKPKTCKFLFWCLRNVKSIDLSLLDTSEVQSMDRMFWYTGSATELDLSTLDTSNVTNMSEMFSGSDIRELDLSSFDTSNVTDMSRMFYGMHDLCALDVSTFDTSSVTDMSYMFYECDSLTGLDISMFDTSSVTDMSNMFYSCDHLTELDLSTFDISNVEKMSEMFYDCTSLEKVDLSNLKGSSLKDMSSMFRMCEKLEVLNLSGFETDCTAINELFYHCRNLVKLDMSGFNGIIRYSDPDSVNVDDEEYETRVFCGCENLTELDIRNIKFIHPEHSDWGCAQRDWFDLTNNLQKITINADFELCYLETVPGEDGDAEWVNGSGEILDAYTLFRTNSHAGTWERERPSYLLTFDAGEGTGQMAAVTNAVSAKAIIFPTFVYARHILTGFADEEGNVYGISNGYFAVPADTYPEGATVKLTAQWEKAESTVEIVGNSFTVTLKAGQTATFPAVPAGMEYFIREEVPAGWSLQNRIGESGVIEPNQTSKAVFVNSRYSPSADECQVVVQKLLDGGIPPAEEFEFELKLIEAPEACYPSDEEEEEEEVVTEYQKGYNAGYADGRRKGVFYGYKDGYAPKPYNDSCTAPSKGESQDEKDGYTEGYVTGYGNGYDYGYGMGNSHYEEYYDPYENYELGYDEGWAQSSDAYSRGYEKGYSDGEAGLEEDEEPNCDVDIEFESTEDEEYAAYLEGYRDRYIEKYQEDYMSGYASGYFDATYVFTLADLGLDRTASNDENGKVAFASYDEWEFSYAGLYVLEMKEIKGSGDYQYDPAVYTVEIKIVPNIIVEDDYEYEDGVRFESITFKDAQGNVLSEPPVFRNASTPGSLTVSKTARNATAMALETSFRFSVSLTGSDGKPMTGAVKDSQGKEYTLDDGTVQLSMKPDESVTLVELPVGTIYKVQEIGSHPGWQMDASVFSGRIATKTESTAAFENVYKPSGEVELSITKTLTGRKLATDEFAFELKDENGVLQTATNRQGSVNFQKITYTQPGTYRYTINEVPGTDSSVVYSTQVIDVEVTVTDETGNGKLTAQAEYSHNATIANSLKTGSLEVSKQLESPVEAHKQRAFTFTVEVKDVDGAPISGDYRLADGRTIAFANGSAVLTLRGGESAVISGLPMGAQYTVTENPESGFTARMAGTEGTIGADKVSRAGFVNTYKATGSYTPAVTKTLTGRTLAAGEFTFKLEDETGAVLQTVTNNADGTVPFETISLNQNHVGERTFYVYEVQGTETGMNYDKTRHQIKLTVNDNGDGTLSVEPAGTVGDIVFENVFSDRTTISATKYWLDDEADPSGRGTVTLTLMRSVGNDEPEAVESKVIAAGAQGDELTVVWNDLPLYNENGEAYAYTVQETMTEAAAALYKSTVLGNAQNGFRIVNRLRPGVKVVIEAEKELKGDALRANQFLFKLTNGVTTVEARNDANGRVAFPALLFTSADAENGALQQDGSRVSTSTWYVSEVADNNPAYKYDNSTFAVAITLTLSADGKLSAGTRVTDAAGEEAQLKFVNSVNTTSFTVTKEWRGGSGPIDLTLYANGTKMEPQPMFDRNGDTYTVSGLRRCDADGREIVYSARETYVDGFITIYNNVGQYADQTGMIYNNGTIINKMQADPSFVVTKVWRGVSGKTPSITLTLYCNGEALDVPTPQPDSHGRYCYYDLPETVNGEKAVYTVVEEPMAGYETTYTNPDGQAADCAGHNGVITNTKLPTTGDEHRPLLWMAGALLSALALMFISRRRQQTGGTAR